jgi:hypothetical protein
LHYDDGVQIVREEGPGHADARQQGRQHLVSQADLFSRVHL